MVCVAAFAFAGPFDEFDARVDRELAAADPDAVVAWRAANVAREAGKHAEAIRLYDEVLRRQPGFSHALRRKAGVELAAGDRASAVAHGRTALQIEQSAENVAFLALALVTVPDGQEPA